MTQTMQFSRRIKPSSFAIESKLAEYLQKGGSDTIKKQKNKMVVCHYGRTAIWSMRMILTGLQDGTQKSLCGLGGVETAIRER